MKELHKLITKDIFDCLSEEDAGRLRELRAELHIDDEAYRQMKKMITSREVHDRIMEVRKKPSRMIKMMRHSDFPRGYCCLYLHKSRKCNKAGNSGAKSSRRKITCSGS